MEDCIRQKENHAYMEHVHTCRSFPTTANAKNIDGRLDKKKKENHAYMEPTSCILKKYLLSCTT